MAIATIVIKPSTLLGFADEHESEAGLLEMCKNGHPQRWPLSIEIFFY